MSDVNWKDIVGKRVLCYLNGRIIEAKVLKVSPSGQYAKIQFLDNPFHVEWIGKPYNVDLLEILD